MSDNDNLLANAPVETPESVFGPPQVDIVGVGLITLLAIFCGLITSVSVLIVAFFSLGRFSLESGVSPMILAMITFFALLFSSYSYIWGASTIFPSIYHRGQIFYIQVTVFMVILYICMMPIYLLVNAVAPISNSILLVYLVHVLLAIFGLELVLALIAQYRYTLLSFYANIISFALTGGVLLWLFEGSTKSEASIFILMGLAILCYTLFTAIVYLARFVYYAYYRATGNDPLGSIFSLIEMEEMQKIQSAEKSLFN